MPTGSEGTQPVTRLVYSSRAIRPFDDDELLDLLQRAQEANARRGVTGVLLYHAGTFVQAIEGEDAVVDELHRRIERDPRHTAVTVVSRTEQAERRFGGWSMAFRRYDRSVELPPGLDDFLESGFVSLENHLEEDIRAMLLGFVGVGLPG